MATRKQVNDLYLKYLGRNATKEGLDYWTSQNLSLSGIEYNIARSPEAQAKTASSTQSTGMFSTDEEDEVIDTEAGGQRDRYGDIIRGVYTGPDTVVFPGQVDYGTIPSDLIRDEIAETQLFRDFISKFGDKLEGKTRSQAAANWLEALVKYGSGDATLKDMQEVDVSGLMGVEGFEDYYNDIVIVQAPTDNASIYKILKGAGYSDEAINEIARASVDNGRFKGNNVLATILRDLGYEADNWEVQPIKNVGDACRNADGPGTIANNGECVTDTSEGTPCYTGSFPDEKEGRRDANGDCIPLDDGTGDDEDGDDGTEDTTFSEEARKVSQAIKDWVEGQIGQVQGMTVEDVLEAVFGGNGYDPQCELTGEGEEPWDCAGTDGTEGNQCWKDCVSASVLGGIPGLPMPPGNIDVGTVRDLENKVEEIGGTISDIFSAPQGDADDEGFIQRAKDWVLGKIEDIFGGIDDVTPGQITGWITGVLGTTISGIILQEIEGKKNDVIDKINEITGLPLDTPTTLINCADYGREGGEVGSVDECGNCLDKTEDIGTDGRCRKSIKDDFDVSEVETTCKREGKEYNDLLDECGDCIQEGYVPGADGVCAPIDGDVDDEVDPRCSNPAFAARNPSLCGEKVTITEGPGFGFGGQPPETRCTDVNATVNEDGSCGDCKNGFTKDPNTGKCVPSGNGGNGGGGTTSSTIYVAPTVDCNQPKVGFSPSFDPTATAKYAEYSENYDATCLSGGVDTGTGDGGGENQCTGGKVRVNGECVCPSGTTEVNGQCVSVGDGGDDGGSTTTTGCSNGATEESGCDTCPDGTSVLQYEDGICPSVSPPPECNDCTCAEYASANPDECGTTPPPPETPSGGTGGTGGTSGASGMFDLESFEITGDPQLLAKMEFPITDFLSGSMFKDYV